jgi:hypothetical protein
MKAAVYLLNRIIRHPTLDNPSVSYGTGRCVRCIGSSATELVPLCCYCDIVILI